MSILLPTLAVAFAAFCVWLTVRIVNRRERWAKRTLVATLLVAYPLCHGPMIYLMGSGKLPASSVSFLQQCFVPARSLPKYLPDPVSRGYLWYIDIWETRLISELEANSYHTGRDWLTAP